MLRRPMNQYLDLDRYPLDQLDSNIGKRLVSRCREELQQSQSFELPNLLLNATIEQCVSDVLPLYSNDSFTHEREHNIFFDDQFNSVSPEHPALDRMKTTNHTICADQISDSVLLEIYQWPPLREFLAAVMNKPNLYLMADPLARVNVMAYYKGESLNWHFDRAEFTTTVLLQASDLGGDLELAYGLRNGSDIDFDGIGKMLNGDRGNVRTKSMVSGTLNVFKGKNTAHRTTPVGGSKPRIVAVFSYFAEPNVVFSKRERLEFYGRTGDS